MERENQRVVITKRILKESMLRLLKETDVDSITVSALCREAGINRSTFYRHYQIPQDILQEIQQDLHREFCASVSLPIGMEETRHAIGTLCHFIDRNGDILRLLFSNANSERDFMGFVNDMYQEMWVEYRNMELFRHLDQDGLQLLTLYSAGGSYFLLRNWLLGNIRKTPEEITACICGLIEKTNWKKAGEELGILMDT